MFRFLLIPVFLSLALAGCSATTLRCSTSAEGDSFVELMNLPQDLSGQVRNYAQLCGFVYDQASVVATKASGSEEVLAKLNIVDSAAFAAKEE